MTGRSMLVPPGLATDEELSPWLLRTLLPDHRRRRGR